MNKKVRFFLLSVICIYLMLNIVVQIQSSYYRWQLDKLDINQDGFFRKHEITPEIEKAMSRVRSDTARSLAPITLIPVSILLAVFLLLIFRKRYR